MGVGGKEEKKVPNTLRNDELAFSDDFGENGF